MSKNSYDNGHKQAEKDSRNDNVSESLQQDSIFDGNLGASRDYKDGYRDSLKEADRDNKK